MSVVVLTYVLAGGMRGTVWVNVFQTVIFLALGGVAFWVIARRGGGFEALMGEVASRHPELVTWGGKIPLAEMLSYLLIPLSAAMFPHLFVHWLTARRAGTFRLAVVAYPFCVAAVWLPSVLLGVLARLDLPDLAPAAASSVVVQMIGLHAPRRLAGVLTAGVFVAVMASIDSQVLALGNMFTQDVVRYYRRGGLDGSAEGERRQIAVGRVFITLVVARLVGALRARRPQHLQDGDLVLHRLRRPLPAGGGRALLAARDAPGRHRLGGHGGSPLALLPRPRLERAQLHPLGERPAAGGGGGLRRGRGAGPGFACHPAAAPRGPAAVFRRGGMRIAYVAAGAAGMYCGSCIHDNTVAAALMRQGHEVALIPTYTPLRTDEQDVSVHRVFYGAINVYLQQKLGLFRHTPRFLDRLLDRPALLSWVSRFSASTSARELSDLTLSVLEGEDGHQAKELEKLVGWLATDYRPDVVHLTNSMFLGMVRRIRREVGVPVLVSVQGEDLFLDDLGEPYRTRAVAALARRAGDADLYLAPSRYYAAAMSEMLGVDPGRMRVVPLGIRLDGHRDGDLGLERRDGSTIGYLARICPEKGFHLLVEAFLRLAREPGRERLTLRAAGYLGEKDRPFLERLTERVARCGPRGSLRVPGRGRPRGQDPLPALARSDVGAHRLPRVQGPVGARGHGQRGAGGGAAPRLVPRGPGGDGRRPAGRAGVGRGARRRPRHAARRPRATAGARPAWPRGGAGALRRRRDGAADAGGV